MDTATKAGQRTGTGGRHEHGRGVETYSEGPEYGIPNGYDNYLKVVFTGEFKRNAATARAERGYRRQMPANGEPRGGARQMGRRRVEK